MPELPEVETVKNGMAVMQGKTIKNILCSDKKLRQNIQAGTIPLLIGQEFATHERRAKYIISHFKDSPTKILWHLGMSGQIIINGDINKNHNHVMIECTDGTWLIYNDPRRFGMVNIFQGGHKNLQKLGREPFGLAGDDVKKYYQKPTAIKLLLLNQEYIVGIGNIYASEILWRAGIHPARPGNSLNDKNFADLAREIDFVLNQAIAKGGSSFSDFRNIDGKMGYFQNEWAVYDKKDGICILCQGRIEKIIQGGRSSFYCAQHQL